MRILLWWAQLSPSLDRPPLHLFAANCPILEEAIVSASITMPFECIGWRITCVPFARTTHTATESLDEEGNVKHHFEMWYRVRCTMYGVRSAGERRHGVRFKQWNYNKRFDGMTHLALRSLHHRTAYTTHLHLHLQVCVRRTPIHHSLASEEVEAIGINYEYVLNEWNWIRNWRMVSILPKFLSTIDENKVEMKELMRILIWAADDIFNR